MLIIKYNRLAALRGSAASEALGSKDASQAHCRTESNEAIHIAIVTARLEFVSLSPSSLTSFLAVFVYQPSTGGFLAECPPAILVADPILNGHHWLQSFRLLDDLFYLRALPNRVGSSHWDSPSR